MGAGEVAQPPKIYLGLPCSGPHNTKMLKLHQQTVKKACRDQSPNEMSFYFKKNTPLKHVPFVVFCLFLFSDGNVSAC